jgi:hypothetical protein
MISFIGLGLRVPAATTARRGIAGHAPPGTIWLTDQSIKALIVRKLGVSARLVKGAWLWAERELFKL